MPSKDRIKITVFGQVQGVFYRSSSRRKAMELGVFGFVRNEPDGTVLIEAEGDEKSLREFVEWCRIGSPRARVRDVKIERGDFVGYDGFEIRD